MRERRLRHGTRVKDGTRFAGETLPHGQKRGEQIRCDAQSMRQGEIPEAVRGSRQRACVGVHRRPQEIQQVFTSENFYTGRLVSETIPTDGVRAALLISHVCYLRNVYTSFPHIQRRESVAIRASGYARGFLTACLPGRRWLAEKGLPR